MCIILRIIHKIINIASFFFLLIQIHWLRKVNWNNILKILQRVLLEGLGWFLTTLFEQWIKKKLIQFDLSYMTIIAELFTYFSLLSKS